MAGQMTDPVKQLKQHLEKYKVAKPFVTYILADPGVDGKSGLGFAAISDFASAFTEDDHAEGLKTEIVKKVEGGGAEMVAVARLRTAWVMAKAELENAKRRRIEGGPEQDWDTPLEENEEERRKKDFEEAYGGIILDTESTPGANLVGRWYREFRSVQRQVSLMSLHKMRSEADYRQLGTVRRQQIGEGVSLVQDQNPVLHDVYFDSVLRLLEAFKLMTNGWALTGTTMVDSKTQYDPVKGTYDKVRNCHYAQAISYFDFVSRKALEFQGTEVTKCAWLLERDRHTRSKAKSLYGQGWPWGEAIHAAKDTHCVVVWTIGNIGANAQRPKAVVPQLDDGQAREEVPVRRLTLSKTQRRKLGKGGKGGGKGGKGGRDTCPKHNSKAGCTKKQSQCPLGKKHSCTKCGQWNHGAARCTA